MSLSPAGLRSRLATPEGRRQLRYVVVSAGFVPFGVVLLQVLAHLLDSYTLASVLNAAILTPFNFFALRYLVWQITSRDNLRMQVTVFWVGAMLAACLATGLVFAAEQATSGRSEPVRGAAAMVAQVTGFTLAWIGRYLVLDRWLFKATHHGEEPSPDLLDELHREIPI